MGPPIPSKPCKNPDMAPPIIVLVSDLGTLKSGLIKNKIEKIKRKIPKMITNVFWGTYITIYAPMIVMNILGTPKSRINLLSKPWRKNVVAPTLADK